MLGKLMKYEWKGLSKPLIVLYLILLVITLLTGMMVFTINPEFDEVVFGLNEALTVLCFMLMYLGIIACSIGTTLIIAIRFYKTCYTDEGYLTHTLPVSAKQLVASKTITAILCNLLSIFVIVVSVVLLVVFICAHMVNLGELMWSDISDAFGPVLAEANELFKNEMGISLVGFIVYIGIICLISSVCGVIMVLGSVSLGQLYTKHRILGAIIAYFAISMILQMVSSLGTIPMYALIAKAELTGDSLTMFTVMNPSLIITLLTSVILGVVLYFANIHMMSKRLNLE